MVYTGLIKQGGDLLDKRERLMMAVLVNLYFRVTENNGGGIALAIKENNRFIYIHSGYESVKGQLIEDIKALFDGQHPSGWDGDELSEFLEGHDVKDRLDSDFWNSNMGVTVIMSKDTVYLSQFLGAAGQEILKSDLGLDDIEDFLEAHKNSMTMTDFLALCK